MDNSSAEISNVPGTGSKQQPGDIAMHRVTVNDARKALRGIFCFNVSTSTLRVFVNLEDKVRVGCTANPEIYWLHNHVN